MAGGGVSPLVFTAWYVVSNETNAALANLTCYLSTDFFKDDGVRGAWCGVRGAG